MRYWVYINDKVDGPYDEDKLASLDGFTPETLICSEEIEEGGSQEWVKASQIFEFDDATKTMTRAPLSEDEMKAVRGGAAEEEKAAEPANVSSEANSAVTQILIDKIDNLTREIEGLKGKLDAALSAAHTPQAPAVVPAPVAEPVQLPTQEPAHQSEPVTEEASITNTASLVSHAEKLVAQASAGTEQKPVDFLDEIQISAPKAENLAEKGGEEVVLRSALDSLYNSKPQPEEEREATFQDLLSPLKAAAVTAAGTAAVAAAVASVDEDKKDEPLSSAEPAHTPEAEPALKPSLEPASEEPAALQSVEPLTEEKREQIINEITSPAQQSDLILQAIEEAQKEEQPAAANLESVTAEPQPAVEPAEKQPLDLSDQPELKLNIVDEEPAVQTVPSQNQAEEQFQPLPQANVSNEVTPLNPTEGEKEEQKEITETVKELVPGKKVEAEKEEGEGLISQADLDEAFTERTPSPEFPLPEADNATPQTEQPAQEPQPALPAENVAPNDMTEVELKEGSTYLISDFIPPAQTDAAANAKAVPAAYGAVPGSSDAAQASADGQVLQVQPVAESVEEIVPTKRADDLTLSKVILENTIKTKRGATMDIKTVPMVEEPADSQRLDLTDSDLDINTQHDMKAADLKPETNKMTKLVLTSAVSVVILALIYVMLAYLEILPAQFNFIKSAPAAQEVQAQDEQLNEMLGIDENIQQGQDFNPFAQPPADPNAAGAALPQNGQMPQVQPAVNPLDAVLTEVKNFRMRNGQTLQQVIEARHQAARSLIEWNITTAVEPQNYSVLVKVPPENPQSFKISYRFNYNTATKTLEPTISDSKNLLDSLNAPQAVR